MKNVLQLFLLLFIGLSTQVQANDHDYEPFFASDTTCFVYIDTLVDSTGILLTAIPTGQGPFTYNWTGGYTTPGIYTTIAGTYCVDITDTIGCSASECYDYGVVLDSCNVVIEATLDSLGVLLEAVPTGTAPFTYSWTGGYTTYGVYASTPGTYCVNITDATGCVSTACYTYQQGGSCNVWIEATPAGGLLASGSGTAPYTYSWSNGSVSDMIFPSAPGTYCVSITDATGCGAVDCYDYGIIVDSCEVWIIEVQNGACLEASNFGVAPYTYSWSDGSTTPSICPDSSALYCVTVEDAVGCIASNCYSFDAGNNCSVFIMEGDSLNLWSILAAVPTGAAPFSFEWNTGETTQIITPTVTGDYCVTTTDANGCMASDCLYYNGGGNDTLCWVIIYQDTLNSTTDLLVADWQQNGPAVTSFQWSSGETGSSIIVSETGNYCITITFADGCVSTACYYYESGNNQCSADIFPPFGDTCLYVNTTGVSPFTYMWEDGSNNSYLCPTTSGEYCVTVIDANGCDAYDCQYISIVDSCNVSIIDSLTGSGHYLIAIPSGTSPFTYSWNNGEASQSIVPPSNGVYCVTMTDATGCVNTACTLYSNGTYNTISGDVYVVDSLNLTQLIGTAFLIQYDTSGGGTLTLIDSVALTQDPWGASYDFGIVPDGEYLVKVALDANSPGYATNLPTYHYSSLFWDMATTITIPYNNFSWFNVILEEGTNPGGPGFIGGLVVEGANFAGVADTRDGEGDPIANILMILTDVNDNAIGYTYTNENGEYAFPDLAWGTYKVIVEILGFEQAIYEITIGPSGPSITDVTFVVDEDSVAFLDATDVEEILKANTFASFPNPVSDQLTIQLEMKTNSPLQIELVSIDGKVQYSQTTDLNAGPQELYLDMSRYANGLYFLNVVHDGDQISTKIIKQ